MRPAIVLGMILVLAGSCGEASDKGPDERCVDEVIPELEAVVGSPLNAEGDVLTAVRRVRDLYEASPELRQKIVDGLVAEVRRARTRAEAAFAVAFHVSKRVDTQVRSAFGKLRSDETEDERLRMWAARLLGARRAVRDAPDVE